LFSLVDRLHNGLRTLFTLCESNVAPKLINVPSKRPESPIFALFTPLPRDLAQYCQQAGFVVRPVVPPTVPAGAERVRICLHTGNTEEQVDAFVEVVKRWIGSKGEEALTKSQIMKAAKL
jgi:8-amino-7-oxononanoate synthase